MGLNLTGGFTVCVSQKEVETYPTNVSTPTKRMRISTSSAMPLTYSKRPGIVSATLSHIQEVERCRFDFLAKYIYIITLPHPLLFQKKGQVVSWKSIESLYLTETSTSTMGVRLCHKLTRDHIWLTSYNRMRVYLAAQVSSYYAIMSIVSPAKLHC